MFVQIRRLVTFAFVVLVGCATSTAPVSRNSAANGASEPPPGKLRVVLYKYIPPFVDQRCAQLRLADWLKRQFIAQHPGVDLNISFDETYDLSPDAGLLGAGDDGADLIEADLTQLPGLRDVVGVWDSVGRETLLPAAAEASKLGDHVLAWPTYSCTEVIYSRDSRLKSVDSAGKLIAFLEEGSDGGPVLVGHLSDIPEVYATAYADEYGTLPTSSTVDGKVAASVGGVAKECGALDDDNPCFNMVFDPDKGYPDGGANIAVKLFATGQSRALFGYTESISEVLAQGASLTPSNLTVVSAPLGSHVHPVLFVDGLIRNPRCNGDCELRAMTFAKFLTSPEIQKAIALGQDSATPRPRYLMMARTSFWQDPQIAADPIYKQLAPIVSDADSIGSPPDVDAGWFKELAGFKKGGQH